MATERAKRMGLKKRLLGLIPTYGRNKIEEGRRWDNCARDSPTQAS